ncbi:hypothetical protein [Methanocella conradii]|uniref:hypothetical protein n=1 Tax=Methanocella conradii TaxID=1175444 RepID=UPI00157CDE93|nr:hypothetical protein [Methanocella conradii]
MKSSKLLFASSIMFYVFYDIVSTIAASKYLGTFDYEKSLILKASYNAAGMAGFILIKLLFSLMALYLAYLLIERFHKFRGVGLGMLAGATCAGLFVGTSNFNIMLNGSSFWIMGMDSGTIAALIIILCAVGGFLLMPSNSPAKGA